MCRILSPKKCLKHGRSPLNKIASGNVFFMIVFLTFVMSFFTANSYADDRLPRYFYRVRALDSLSMILYRFGIKPIYGDKGTLSETIAMNPKILKNQGEQIFPGDILYLPLENEDRLRGVVHILPTGEIILDKTFPAPESITTEIGPSSSEEKLGREDADQSLFVVPQLIYTGIFARDKNNGR